MVHIVDAMMGAGKTSAAINYINSNKKQKHFIFITPYLDEVERIKEKCGFYEPIKYHGYTPKIIDFKKALSEQKNIVTTHALFSYFDDEVIDICRAFNYELIMDEVHNVIDTLDITKYDAEILLNECVDIADDGTLKWKETKVDYQGEFEKYKCMCNNSSLVCYGGSLLVWMFPIRIFSAFKESYILTYMFEHQIQRCYFDYYNLKYDYMYVTSDYHFTTDQQNISLPHDYLSLIKILADSKLNAIGIDEFDLSKQWYKRNKKILVKQLKNNLRTFFRNRECLYTDSGFKKCASKDCLWTTFSQYEDNLAGDGYAKGFLACNMKATNEYKERTVVAYTVNRYINPVIFNFFKERGIELDQNGFATSEMIQFIWRSGIRDGKHVTLYIPSARMRLLFTKWLASLYGIMPIEVSNRVNMYIDDGRTEHV